MNPLTRGTTVKHPAILVIVKFKSALSVDELRRRYKERMPQFEALPGLIQKYYFHDAATDEWGGVYLWDSRESMQAYAESDLRKSIPEVYEIVGTPRVEAITVVDILRP